MLANENYKYLGTLQEFLIVSRGDRFWGDQKFIEELNKLNYFGNSGKVSNKIKGALFQPSKLVHLVHFLSRIPSGCTITINAQPENNHNQFGDEFN